MIINSFSNYLQPFTVRRYQSYVPLPFCAKHSPAWYASFFIPNPCRKQWGPVQEKLERVQSNFTCYDKLLGLSHIPFSLSVWAKRIAKSGASQGAEASGSWFFQPCLLVETETSGGPVVVELHFQILGNILHKLVPTAIAARPTLWPPKDWSLLVWLVSLSDPSCKLTSQKWLGCDWKHLINHIYWWQVDVYPLVDKPKKQMVCWLLLAVILLESTDDVRELVKTHGKIVIIAGTTESTCVFCFQFVVYVRSTPAIMCFVHTFCRLYPPCSYHLAIVASITLLDWQDLLLESKIIVCIFYH